VKFASEEKNGATLSSSSLFYTSKSVWGYVFVHGRTFVNFGDDIFGYYTNAMVVLSTLKRLRTSV
jgi:hypothetical protein